jgi:hypothetical protein
VPIPARTRRNARQHSRATRGTRCKTSRRQSLIHKKARAFWAREPGPRLHHCLGDPVMVCQRLAGGSTCAHLAVSPCWRSMPVRWSPRRACEPGPATGAGRYDRRGSRLWRLALTRTPRRAVPWRLTWGSTLTSRPRSCRAIVVVQIASWDVDAQRQRSVERSDQGPQAGSGTRYRG